MVEEEKPWGGVISSLQDVREPMRRDMTLRDMTLADDLTDQGVRLEVNSTQVEVSKFAYNYNYWGRQDGKVELSGVST